MGLIGPIECQSIDEMKTVMDTNFFGLVRLLKEILPDMKRRKRGHIVVISSVMGIQGDLILEADLTGAECVNDVCAVSFTRHPVQRRLRSIQVCSGGVL